MSSSSMSSSISVATVKLRKGLILVINLGFLVNNFNTLSYEEIISFLINFNLKSNPPFSLNLWMNCRNTQKIHTTNSYLLKGAQPESRRKEGLEVNQVKRNQPSMLGQWWHSTVQSVMNCSGQRNSRTPLPFFLEILKAKLANPASPSSDPPLPSAPS